MYAKFISVALLTFVFISSSSAKEPPCIPPRLIGSVELNSTAFQWVYDSGFGYVVTVDPETELPELTCVDMHDPANPTIVGSVALPETWVIGASPIVSEGVLFLFGFDRILIVDVSVPALPVIGGEYTLETIPHIELVTLHDHFLYIGGYPDTTEIVDITLPFAPIFAGAGGEHSPLLAVVNGVGYSTGGQAIDLTDPTDPIALGSPPLSAGFRSFHVDHEVLFLYGDYTASLDISDPLNPVEIEDRLGSYFDPDGPSFVRGSLRVGTDMEYSGSLIVDDLSIPAEVLSTQYVFFDYSYRIKGLFESDGITWVLSEEALSAYEISFRPTVVTSLTSGDANDIVLFGDHAAVVCDGGYIEIFDISNPEGLELISTVPLLDDAWGVEASGGMLYVANYREHLNIFDITNPVSPLHVANIDTGRRTVDVEAVEGYLYVVDRFDGLSIFNIQNPRTPELISESDTPGWAREVTVDPVNQIAYIAQNQYDLQILDISDPSLPVAIGTITPLDDSPDGSGNGGLGTSTLVGELLYTAEAEFGYRIFDVSNPASPVELHHVVPVPEADSYPDWVGSNFVHQLEFDGTRMYVANGTSGFIAYDYSDPENPVQVDWLPTRFDTAAVSSSRRIQVRDGYVYTAVNEGGVRVYNFESCGPCIADMNGDDMLDFYDVSAFIEALLNQHVTADLQPDGSFDFFDVSAFLNAFTAGCP